MSIPNKNQKTKQKKDDIELCNFKLENLDAHPYLRSNSSYKKLLIQILSTQNSKQFSEKADQLAVQLMNTRNFKEVFYHLDTESKKVKLYTTPYSFDPIVTLNQNCAQISGTNFNFLNTLGKMQTRLSHSWQKNHKKINFNYKKQIQWGFLNFGYRFHYKKPLSQLFYSNNHNFYAEYQNQYFTIHLSSSSRKGQPRELPLQKQVRQTNFLKKSDLWTLGLQTKYINSQKLIKLHGSLKLGMDADNKSYHAKIFANFDKCFNFTQSFTLSNQSEFSVIKGKNILPHDLIHPKREKWMGERCQAYIKNRSEFYLFEFPFLSTFRLAPYQFLTAVLSKTVGSNMKYQVESGFGIKYLLALEPMFIQFPILQMKKQPGVRIRFSF